ncbi:MAG: preprotein translocase subunit SecE [bacterium]|nr:preprotein translocase subunit SecE [bacterium]
MNKITNYLKGAREELAKVVWPSRETTINHTLVVIGVSVFVALFLGLIDMILSKVLELIIS